jgi:hypothetical protein
MLSRWVNNFSKDSIALIFRVKQYKSTQKALLGLLSTEDEGTMSL